VRVFNKRDVCARKDEALVWESLNSEVTDWLHAT
jgi:hypothetical protein